MSLCWPASSTSTSWISPHGPSAVVEVVAEESPALVSPPESRPQAASASTRAAEAQAIADFAALIEGGKLSIEADAAGDSALGRRWRGAQGPGAGGDDEHDRDHLARGKALVEPDEIGNGREIGDGTVSPEQVEAARMAVLNCPEQAVILEEDD